MLARERRKLIIQSAEANGAVQVADLASELNVTTMTIRRDLQYLEEKGILERCHGGAVINQETNFNLNRTAHADAKIRLAEKAVDFINDNMTVYLDSGTTTCQIADQIMKRELNIQIITVNLEAALLLCQSDCDVVLIGGSLQKENKGTVGYWATEMISRYHMDIGFFGAVAVDSGYYNMAPSSERAFLKSKALKVCEKSYLVTDSSKFGRTAAVRSNSLADYSGVITDRIFSSEEKKQIRMQRINIIDVSDE
jgi:DeoR family fructose operon transcriptional repressor